MKLYKFSGNLDDIDYLSMLVVDINGQLRSVSLPRSYVTDKVLKNGIGFDASNFGFAQVHHSDMVAIPDMQATFVEERDGFRILHAFCDVWTTQGELFEQYPRTIAKKAVEHMKKTGIGDDAKMLVELEFYVFDDVKYSTTVSHSYYMVESCEGIGENYEDVPRFGLSKGYHRLTPDDRYNQLRNEVVACMQDAGIPVKYHHHEVGAAQLEIELNFISLVGAADAVVLSKWIIKTIAQEMGLYVTFMPKPMYKIAGSGMHVHQFVEKNGSSIFPGEGMYGLSEQGLAYTAGILSHALKGSLLAWSNPSTNSYRRLVPGYEAPVAATFAQASRAAAVRIPGYLKKGEARIEFRTGDATANVYYFLAAMLLAGLDGIQKKMDPVAMGFSKTQETAKNTFPTGLFHVLAGLKKDNEYLLPVFPKNLIDSWIALKEKEAEYVYNAPVPQEYELYF
ncbi:MAG TPA: glutamine synthetase beta-grasp domain-containing protein [Spirochaetales bacterium]|nr:glutamine synthetase beta-grasp domain-containing protein [Spirochaetales bacterium]